MIIFNKQWAKEQVSGLWEEMAGVRPVMIPKSLGQPLPPTLPQDVDLNYAETWVPFSDLKAARIIQLQMNDRLTYTGRWYYWNGVYHQEVASGIIGDNLVEAFTDQIVMAMDAVAQRYDDLIAQAVLSQNVQERDRLKKEYKSKFGEHKKYQQRLHSDAGLNSLKNRLQKQCTKEPNYFDDDRRWLVCQNGVIDLHRFRETFRVADAFLPHSPERPVSRSVECAFNPAAKAPVWEHFLETSLPDPELREFLQRLVGAAFLGESKVKAIPELVGPKDCGKSMFVSTLERLAGGYGIQPSPSALMKQTGQNFEQETVRGKRFVGISEPNPSDKLDDTFCKQVTGGDVVHTRGLYQGSTGWVAQCVMFIASNHPVKFNTQDKAFTDRLCIVRFPHQFFDATEAPAGEVHIKDPHLDRKLQEESEGIFLWVLMGMWKFLVHGIGKPESVKAAGTEIVVDTSPALSWVRDRVEDGLLMEVENVVDLPQSHYALLGPLHEEYIAQCFLDSEKPMGKHAFGKHLYSHYGPAVKSGGQRIPRLVGTGKWEQLMRTGQRVVGV